MRRAGRVAGVATALGAALVLAACTGTPAPAPLPPAKPGASVPPTSSLASYYAQKVTWSDCGGGFLCGKVTVPVDYKKPGTAAGGAGDLRLAVIRLPATDPANRIGSLLVNPGGPGVSGISYARDAQQAFTAKVRAVYDIVGFDPRGIGASDPIHCVSSKQLDTQLSIDGSPDDAAEEQALLDVSSTFARGCATESPSLVGTIGTVDAARDMDVIRAVLGDATLSYYGASYGTFLGATYAEEFPSKVGRLVLDGAIDPTLDTTALNEGQLGGFERALTSFLTDCVSRSDCPVGPTVDAARARIEQLVRDADARPLTSSSGRPVTQSLVVIGILWPLYDQQNGWPALRSALATALKGDGSQLLALSDSYYERSPNGSYVGNTNEATIAINCLDRSDRSTLAHIRANAARFAAESPIFGAYFAWDNLPCRVWPVAATDEPHAIHAKGAAPILVVSTTRDPATPYQWGVALAGQLESGRLLTRVGDGHTAYTRGSVCIDDAVDAYLVSGTLPPVGTVCQT